MKNKALTRFARDIAVLAAVSGVGGLTPALAGDREPAPPVHFSGLLDDFTPSAAVVAGGPYEMHGKWWLDVDLRRGTAKFSAEMNMETSDYGIAQGSVNKDDPTSRVAHTHHISMTDGVITPDWMTACPVFNPAVTGGFVITGPAVVTGNGSPPKFGNPSTLTICILGGTTVKYSNITLTFGAKANTHFGIYPIHGVIVRCAGPWEFESKDCTVEE